MKNLLNFSEKVKKNRLDLVNLLIKLKARNKTIIIEYPCKRDDFIKLL